MCIMAMLTALEKRSPDKEKGSGQATEQSRRPECARPQRGEVPREVGQVRRGGA